MGYKDIDKKRECQRLWVSSRRSLFFSDKTCSNCTSDKNLELHHRDPREKEANSIWSWSARRREEEILKCDVLCQKCHKNHHVSLMVRSQHGTDSKYHKGCRCDECRRAHAKATHEYRLIHGR